ncbi:hypothetical protein DITRI_Ditri02bG0156400 [Diplodiscus trichospermus]
MVVNFGCVFLVSVLILSLGVSSEPVQDKQALLAFLSQTKHSNPVQWNSSTSACDWVGVECDANRSFVYALRLPSVGLVGSIPPNTIGRLNRLRVLSLRANRLAGEIPADFSNLTLLRGLYLQNNAFTGPFPPSVINLTLLTRLDLSSNNFTGPIPFAVNNLTHLTRLFLQNNKFSGSLPSINSEDLNDFNVANNSLSDICKLNVLYYVNLSSNQFTEFPSFLKGSRALIFLDLSNNKLTGVISDICKLKALNSVYLASNQFTEFPCFLKGSKSLINLDLSNNRIHGQISQFPWEDMEFLDLHSNFIQGDLPKLPRKIRFLSVSNNNLTGQISDICNLKFLEILDLSRNNFSGIIPRCIGSFSQSLSLLNLKMNKFHRNIPSTFAKGCALKNLDLNSNHLEGPLTGSISNCRDLEVLDLGNNKINGTFPRWIEVLPELQVLVLRSNKFHGSIGISKNPWSLQRLRIMDLSNNNFSGPLPTSYIRNFRGMMKLDEGKAVHYMGERSYSSYGYSVALVIKGFEIELVKILTIFTSIDLSNNNFEGEIPKTFGELTSLRGLNLSHNNLVGHIPVSLRNLTQLEWLDLSRNKLGGQIPSELVDLTFLSFFDVSYNQLVGPIPQGKQFDTFENGSYEGNEGLCGLPLSKGCRSDDPQPLMNSDDDSKPEFGWKVVLIGYGSGFIFGVGMGCIALRMGKPKWLMTLIG